MGSRLVAAGTESRLGTKPKRAGPRRAAQMAKTRGMVLLDCVGFGRAPEPDQSQKLNT